MTTDMERVAERVASLVRVLERGDTLTWFDGRPFKADGLASDLRALLSEREALKGEVKVLTTWVAGDLQANLVEQGARIAENLPWKVRATEAEARAQAAEARATLVEEELRASRTNSGGSPPAAVKSDEPCKSDMETLDPKRWEVSVNVDGTNVLTIGSHGYLAGYEDIDRFGDAVRAAAEHLQSFIGTGEPTPCFVCDDTRMERWMGANGEEVGPCSLCCPAESGAGVSEGQGNPVVDEPISPPPNPKGGTE